MFITEIYAELEKIYLKLSPLYKEAFGKEWTAPYFSFWFVDERSRKNYNLKEGDKYSISFCSYVPTNKGVEDANSNFTRGCIDTLDKYPHFPLKDAIQEWIKKMDQYLQDRSISVAKADFYMQFKNEMGNLLVIADAQCQNP